MLLVIEFVFLSENFDSLDQKPIKLCILFE